MSPDTLAHPETGEVYHKPFQAPRHPLTTTFKASDLVLCTIHIGGESLKAFPQLF
jgi:hypothetical protein